MKNFKIIGKITIYSIIFSLLFSISAFAAKGTYFGMSNYDICSYGLRAGGQYVQNMADTLSSTSLSPTSKIIATYSLNRDSTVDPGKMTGMAGSADLFVAAGHGLRYDAFTNFNNYSAAHFHSSLMFDGRPLIGESNDVYNLNMDEITFSSQAKWALFYTCNWLTSDSNSTILSHIYSKFNNGLHLMLGFGSRMYLDSREGTQFAKYLRDSSITYSIKNAFLNAATTYQPQLPSSGGTNGSCYVKVFGAKTAETESQTSIVSTPAPYSSNPSGYSEWTKIIPCLN